MSAKKRPLVLPVTTYLLPRELKERQPRVGKTKQPKRKRLVRCPHCEAMLNPKYALAHVIDTHSDDLD